MSFCFCFHQLFIRQLKQRSQTILNRCCTLWIMPVTLLSMMTAHIHKLLLICQITIRQFSVNPKLCLISRPTCIYSTYISSLRRLDDAYIISCWWQHIWDTNKSILYGLTRANITRRFSVFNSHFVCSTFVCSQLINKTAEKEVIIR